MVTIGDPPLAQVCSPQYDTECKTVQDEKCEIRSALDYPLYCQGVEICFQEGEIEICHLGEGERVTNFMLVVLWYLR